MNALVLLLLPVALAASPDQRIVNGQNVNIANYPWQVCDIRYERVRCMCEQQKPVMFACMFLDFHTS